MNKNSEYMSGEELLKRWRIQPMDLYQMLMSDGIKIQHTLSDTFSFGQVLFLGLEDIPNAFFRKEDILEFERKNPEYAPQETPYITKDGETPFYLNRKHEFFSEELSIAIETWLAIFGPDGKFKTKTSPKTQIMAYLEERHKNLSKTAKERIATMINPQKEGGAPKIE